jgi:hypothetical protein
LVQTNTQENTHPWLFRLHIDPVFMELYQICVLELSEIVEDGTDFIL